MKIAQKNMYGRLFINGECVVDHGNEAVEAQRIIVEAIQKLSQTDMPSEHWSTVDLRISRRPVKEIKLSESEQFDRSMIEIAKAHGNFIELAEGEDVPMADFPTIGTMEFVETKEQFPILGQMMQLRNRPFNFSAGEAESIRKQFIDQFRNTKFMIVGDKNTQLMLDDES